MNYMLLFTSHTMVWLVFLILLGLFTALSLSMNHVYTTKTLGKELWKEQRTLCKGFTYKNFKYTLFVGTNVKPNQEN